jgi:hypothetical protein
MLSNSFDIDKDLGDKDLLKGSFINNSLYGVNTLDREHAR